ncbi:hypothetical protein D5F01_LYC12253 [Larimichthys crocea]|uniref:CCHC-type domain-containing protein n=1 Tax=Larimichthys crocea TaxID=215358 RepID=A0A6G0IAD9_LARCR|nr:hypothetical protein D5F01_LYC12253 [Larimichthys crocea]
MAESFIRALYELSENCDFGETKSEHIRDRLVVGIRDKGLSRRLQLMSDLKLETAVQMVRQAEDVAQQISQQERQTTLNVHEVSHRHAARRGGRQHARKRTDGAEQARSEDSRCRKCGKERHKIPAKCPALDSECRKCGKRSHWERKCFSKSVREEDEQGVDNMLSQDEASNVSEILSAIQSLSKDLNAQLGEVRNEFSTQLHDVISSNHEIKEAIGTFSERLTQAESRISAAEDQIASLTEATDTTREKVHKLDMQMEETENQRRRCNLKLVGIPEGFEKRDCRGFLRAWLPQVLSIEHQLNIEQAYRLGATPSTQNQQQSATKPRVVLVKFLSYHDRDTVLKAACLKEVKLENNHVMFFCHQRSRNNENFLMA